MSLKPYFLSKGYVCPVCTRIYPTIYSLRLHVTVHLRNNCPICGYQNYTVNHFYRSSDPYHILFYAALPKNHAPRHLRKWSNSVLSMLMVNNIVVSIDTRKMKSQLVLYVDEDKHRHMISEACKTLRKNLGALSPSSSPFISPVHRLAAPYA